MLDFFKETITRLALMMLFDIIGERLLRRHANMDANDLPLWGLVLFVVYVATFGTLMHSHLKGK